mgnify:CR=1 FL=1
MKNLVSKSSCSNEFSESDPVLLYNDDSNGIKVLSSLISSMDFCDSFDFSVAFITMGGLSTLYQVFRNLNERGIKGRILTTDYLQFNDPNALKWLLDNTNHELRICEERFHTKGYIFYKADEVTTFVGSSNLTQEALCINKEWNLRIITDKEDSITQSICSEFEKMWNEAVPLTYEWIDDYRVRYQRSKQVVKQDSVIKTKEIKPNEMQVEALKSIQSLRDNGKTRALLISATGTGKTYLSAFDVKAFNPKRMLFLVHNENILKDARNSYENVLGPKYKYGFYTGNQKDADATAIFSTIQTMQKQMEKFPRDYFDYIVCDEAHHSTAGTYRRILQYFHPKFLLGMTATPERMDQADVFQMFDYNIAYEIRLNKALEMGILCPFHYFGISEITVNGKLIEDKSDFSTLTSDERVKNIIEKAEFYKPYGKKVHGLIFCSRVDECKVLSEKMNKFGYNTMALSGDDSIDSRKAAIESLRSEESGSLDYIFTRDVFNEGVDIPEVNQILMLRPTQSAIIFVQQLGRGLRKVKDQNKSLIVLDFIGNYENNFMIPIALSGDKSHDKDNLRRFMMSRYLPGCSTVGFDRIVEERILNNINKTNLSKLTMLKSEYLMMKARLGRQPTLCDLLHGGSLDPEVVVDYAGNLNKFRLKSKQDVPALSVEEDDMLTFVSSFVSGKRPHELVVLSKLIEQGEVTVDHFSDYDQDSIKSAISVLSGGYHTNLTKSQHPAWSIVVCDGSTLRFSEAFRKALSNPEFVTYVEDAVECGLEINQTQYNEVDNLGFQRYRKYTRADVCRILNWESDFSSTLYGYRVRNNQCPIFVTYNKSDDISNTTKYVEGFENRSVFDWMTRSDLTLQSKEVVSILNAEKTNMDVLLFVKKSDSEGSDFYYLGQVSPIASKARETEIGNKSVVGIPLKIHEPISEEIYSYLTSNVDVRA